MSTTALVATNTGAGGSGGNAAPAAGTQEAVNSADSFESAAESLLNAEPEAPQADAADGTKAGSAGNDEAAADGVAKTDAVAAGGAAKPGEEAVKTAAAQADEWAIDQALLDKALADPTHGAIVKALHEKYQKLGEFRTHWGTLAEARDARALVPGGLEELKEKIEIARSATAENADFASGDPAKQEAVLQSLAADMPEQFGAALPAYLRIAAEKAPAAFQKAVMEHTMIALKNDGVPEVLGKIFTALDGNPDDGATQKAFGDALAQLRTWADNAGFTGKAATGVAKTGQVDPELTRAQARIKELEGTQHQQAAEKYNTWAKPAFEKIESGLKEKITTFVDSYIAKTIPTAVRSDLMTRITQDIFNDVTKQILADAGHQERVAGVLSGWKAKPDETATQWLNLTVGRAAKIIPSAGAKYISPYTDALVAQTKEKNEKEAAASTRADVTGGAGGHVKQQLSVKDVRGSGFLKGKSDEEILDL